MFCFSFTFLGNINHSPGSEINEEPTISTISTASIDTNLCAVFGSIQLGKSDGI